MYFGPQPLNNWYYFNTLTMALPDMEVISFKGRKDKWFDFVNVVKKRRERVWDALERCLDDYMHDDKMAPIQPKGRVQNGK